MVDDPIDRGGRGHGILDDPVPLGEDEVARHDHGAPLVALGEDGDEHLHLLARLLTVANVVDDDEFVADRRHDVRLAAPGQPEGQQVLGAVDESVFAERAELARRTYASFATAWQVKRAFAGCAGTASPSRPSRRHASPANEPTT